MNQPVKVHFYLNKELYKTESIDLRMPLSYLRDILDVGQNFRFLSLYGPIDPFDESSISTKDVLTSPSEIHLQTYVSYGSTNNISTGDFGMVSEETKEHQDQEDDLDEDITESDSGDSSGVYDTEDLAMQVGGNEMRGLGLATIGSGTISQDIRTRLGKGPLFKVLRGNSAETLTNTTEDWPPAVPRLITSDDVTRWYQDRRIKKIYYEPDRCRFHRTTIFQTGKKSEKVRVFLNIDHVVGRIFTNELDLMFDQISNYYAKDFTRSQTQYLYYLDGEFVLSRDKM
jgi:hypothetical protein